ncbi:MAG: metal ABC transporter substrate-binding protein [Verrucomicrobiales bacterium]|nr:metal ABC transporter substrate-binding protein [Verrucomicrobiales bacterium]
MKTFFFLALSFVLSSALFHPVSANEPMVVQAANYPLAYFAERIGTDSFEIQYLVDPEVDPAFWKPSDEAMMAFQQADIILRNGATYSKWMHHASLPVSAIVDSSREFRDSFIKSEGEMHTHGDGTVHSHGGVAFTTWIDFSQAAKQAEAIARRFAAVKPYEAEEIQANLEALKKDLAGLDASMKSLGGKIGSTPLLASHPIYQYMARAYGLKIEALEWEPEMEMTDEALGDLAKLQETHKAAWMIWEDEPGPANVTALAAQGIRSVVFSPCANRPVEGDWLSVMKQNLENLAEVVPQGGE